MKSLFLSVLMLIVVASPAFSQDVARIDRLERLATFLETKVSPDRFDISSWGNGTRADDPEYTGCAGGYGTIVFKDDGLYLREDRLRDEPVVAYGSRMGTDAMRKFMGITGEESSFLFSSVGQAGKDPKIAAKNIRAVATKYKVQRSLALIAFR